MNAVHALAITLLVTATATGFAEPGSTFNSTQKATYEPWGPSWIGGGPPGGYPRPEKLDKPVTVINVGDDETNASVTVTVWGDAEVQKGNRYQLVYQLRIHTKKGELGPVLGTAAKPTGTTFPIASGTADDKWNGLEGRVEVKRKDITGMTNLPTKGLVTLRVEPQLYDATAAKFLTPGKTEAIIVMATVGDDGQVESIVSLRKWIAATAPSDADKVLSKLADLDEYSYWNTIGEAIGEVLNNKEIPTATKVRFIQAVPKGELDPKSSPNLWGTLKKFADGNDAKLKKAAKARLGE